MNGLEWKQYFVKKSVPYLKKQHAAMTVILSDPMLKKEYGAGAGLDTIRWFIENLIKEKTEKR